VTDRPWPVSLALAWMGVILWLSTPQWSARATGGPFYSLLAVMLPGLPATDARVLHRGVRSVAHVIEYAVLALLWSRALAHRGPAGSWSAGAIVVGWALVDEAFQAAGGVRIGRLRDVGLDIAGGTLGLCIGLASRRREEAPGPPARG
jgi:VanZ family protein